MFNLLTTQIEVFGLIFALTIILALAVTALFLFLKQKTKDDEEPKTCTCKKCEDNCNCKTEELECNCDKGNCTCRESNSQEELENVQEAYEAFVGTETEEVEEALPVEEPAKEEVSVETTWEGKDVKRDVMIELLKAANVKGISKLSKADLRAKCIEMGITGIYTDFGEAKMVDDWKVK